MAKEYDFVTIFRLLDEMEKCADSLHKISSDFQTRVLEDSYKKAA